jgi:hypothetical protein
MATKHQATAAAELADTERLAEPCLGKTKAWLKEMA